MLRLGDLYILQLQIIPGGAATSLVTSLFFLSPSAQPSLGLALNCSVVLVSLSRLNVPLPPSLPTSRRPHCDIVQSKTCSRACALFLCVRTILEMCDRQKQGSVTISTLVLRRNYAESE